MEAADAAVRSAVVFFPLSLCLEHHRRAGLRDPHQAPEPGTPQDRRMEFKSLVEAAKKWCSGNPFDLIFAEEEDERRLDFYADPGVSFYVLCPGGTDNFVREPPQGLQAQCVCMCVRVGVSRLARRWGCPGCSPFFSSPPPPHLPHPRGWEGKIRWDDVISHRAHTHIRPIRLSMVFFFFFFFCTPPSLSNAI